jgi:hypothetical protein
MYPSGEYTPSVAIPMIFSEERLLAGDLPLIRQEFVKA